GTPFQPIQDTAAFPAGASSESARAVSSAASETEAGKRPWSIGAELSAADTSEAACGPNGTTLCLNKGRFRVQAQWSGQGLSGAGQAITLSSDTGYFWFFDA